jgi:hypothetical protein
VTFCAIKPASTKLISIASRGVSTCSMAPLWLLVRLVCAYYKVNMHLSLIHTTSGAFSSVVDSSTEVPGRIRVESKIDVSV